MINNQMNTEDVILELDDWRVEGQRNSMYAVGKLINDERLTDETPIKTDTIDKITEEKDCFVIKTRSGVSYRMRNENVNIIGFDETMMCLQERIFHIIKRFLFNPNAVNYGYNKVTENLEPNELYLQIIRDFPIRAVYKNSDGEIVKTYTDNYHGIEQSSFIIVGEDGLLDFRFLQSDRKVKIYCWNKELKAVKVDIGSFDDFIFEADHRIDCKVKTITTIKRNQLIKEGSMVVSGIKTRESKKYDLIEDYKYLSRDFDEEVQEVIFQEWSDKMGRLDSIILKLHMGDYRDAKDDIAFMQDLKSSLKADSELKKVLNKVIKMFR